MSRKNSTKDTFETYTYSLISENKRLKHLLGNLETRFKGIHKHEIDEASVCRLHLRQRVQAFAVLRVHSACVLCSELIKRAQLLLKTKSAQQSTKP